MAKKIVVIGSGFAGLWTAIGAKRLIDLNKSLLVDQDVEVLVVAPEPKLVIRPPTGIRFAQGVVHTIRTKEKEIEMVDMAGVSSKLSYDKLVLAAGSRLVRPEIPGLKDHAFSIDTIREAANLEAHLRHLVALPSTQARNTVVICGGGFTGIELATELPRRLRAILGLDTKVRVILAERANVVGPSLGDNVRPIITKALEDVGAEVKLGVTIKSVDAGGIVSTSGERIEALTVVWTVGMEASPLTQQIPGERDTMGRLIVDRNLRVPSCTDIFATGDMASARTDDVGNYTLMSCQHAIPLGRVSGYNVAADVLKIDLRPYEQPHYETCLDLGAWGSVITSGWERQVVKAGAPMKEAKEFVNRILIYPPTNPVEAFAFSDPDWVGPSTKAYLDPVQV
ncbi:pyridine nucleotide-disulfide oxidoreductase domain-containing protein [Trichoderma breve]|uniref:Pyridine nucleotide-disulfide oxidoreductase domain-containing protein n=1 Tax=Trichoderma breve TaxID=2034170 RepID=A0A9W9BHC2_9HYPO|nr:pyridine nucleotide-disulfide oxidoreductase domain-containing protein [Trichoderma breve]KAJ4859541.1 pyridine nucleotide-disulfide oxidoreductase domain-containing protein [Trichoderma breve]